MKIHKQLFGVIILFLLTQSVLSQLFPILTILGNVMSWSTKIWSLFHTDNRPSNILKLTYDTMEESQNNAIFQEISQSVANISQKFMDLKGEIITRTENIEKGVVQAKNSIMINRRIFELDQKIGTIDAAYETFKNKIPSHNESFTPGDMCLFAMHQLYGKQIEYRPGNTLHVRSLLNLLRPFFELKKRYICGLGHSPYHYLYAMYMKLLAVEMKAYVITVYSHSLLSKYNGTMEQCIYRHGNTNAALDLARNRLRDDVQKYNNMFITKMQGVQRTYRACDQQKDFIRDVTYFELEGVFQGILHILTEGYHSNNFLSHLKRQENCTSCADQGAEWWEISFCMPESQFCKIHPPRSCFGRIYDCLDIGDTVEACLEENGPRRYEWLKANNSQSGTRKEKCKADKEITSNSKGKNFLCLCNDNNVESPTTHIVNLQPVSSDVADNMVVTGVRFLVKYGILQLQIQQGKLGANCKVTEVDWKPINDISDEVRRVRLGRRLDEDHPPVVEDEDFLILSRGKNNKINLDTLTIPHGHVLTGVKLTLIKDPVHRIGISLMSTEFNHITGKLCTHCQPVTILSERDHNRQLLYYDTKNPYNPQFPTLPDSQSGDYVVINPSDLKTDAGQATLPYFDAIPVVSNPPAPLGGVGIFHKTKNDFAGFLSLELVSLNYVDYMKDSESEFDKQVNMTVEDPTIV